MSAPNLLPSDVSDAVEALADHAARENLRDGSYDELVIHLPDVWANGIPAGEYEVVIRPKQTELGKKLAGLDNPWMRGFD